MRTSHSGCELSRLLFRQQLLQLVAVARFLNLAFADHVKIGIRYFGCSAPALAPLVKLRGVLRFTRVRQR